jgi:hypothetical protein
MRNSTRPLVVAGILQFTKAQADNVPRGFVSDLPFLPLGVPMNVRAHATLAVALVAAIFLASACFELTHTTSPTEQAEIISALSTGTWSSNSAIGADACGNFKWQITELTSTTAKGSFSATCSGGITLVGTADGTLNGNVLTYTANGTASTTSLACAYTLTGTAQKEGTGVRVYYIATTCMGTFTGSQLLTK